MIVELLEPDIAFVDIINAILDNYEATVAIGLADVLDFVKGVRCRPVLNGLDVVKFYVLTINYYPFYQLVIIALLAERC